MTERPAQHYAPAMSTRLDARSRRRRLALFHFAGGSLLLSAVAHLGATAWLTWPAVSLMYVGLAYGFAGPALFRKEPGQRIARAITVAFLMPYLGVTALVGWMRTRRDPAPRPVTDGVCIGPYPGLTRLRQAGVRSVVDVTAELWAVRAPRERVAIPCLEGLTPETAELTAAVRAIERMRCFGAVLVCSGAGRARCAAAVVAWLYATGRAHTIFDAMQWVRRADPAVRLDEAELLARVPQVRHAWDALKRK